MQVVILPIAERHIDYAREIKDIIFSEEIRVEINDENATLGLKSEKQKWKKFLTLLSLETGDGEPYTEYPET